VDVAARSGRKRRVRRQNFRGLSRCGQAERRLNEADSVFLSNARQLVGNGSIVTPICRLRFAG
jgi:hypothetical protein